MENRKRNFTCVGEVFSHHQQSTHGLKKGIAYDGWNPVPWYEQRGFNVTSMHLAPENMTSLGRGLVRTSGTVVRPEELGIVLVVLLLWAAAITLFINRWGKIRLMEPYQPHFEASTQPQVSNTARPSVCHLSSSIDRRPSVMIVNCLDETSTRRKSSVGPHYSSNLSVHRVENNRSAFIPGLRQCHLGYSASPPERRASFVSIFHHQLNSMHSANNIKRLGMRRKSEMNPVSADRLSSALVKPLTHSSRRTSLQIPNFGISNMGNRTTPFQSLLSLSDNQRSHLICESKSVKTKPVSRNNCTSTDSNLPKLICTFEENDETTDAKPDKCFDENRSSMIRVPQFCYTSATPETEKKSPDFQKVAQSNFFKKNLSDDVTIPMPGHDDNVLHRVKKIESDV